MANNNYKVRTEICGLVSRPFQDNITSFS